MKNNMKLMLCLAVTIALAGCNSKKTYNLTYVDGENRTTVKVQDGETIDELLKINSKVGYDAYWTIDDEKVGDGLTYNYGGDKEAVLVYVPHTWKIVFDNAEHTKINVTFDSPIGNLPVIPSIKGYKNGVWTIENTVISLTTIYKWDKDTFATASYDKDSYTLSFEGLADSENLEVYYDSAVGKLPKVPDYSGKGQEHYKGFWTIDGEIITEDSLWQFETNKVAKPLYKAIVNDLKNGSTINTMSETITELYAAKSISGASLLEKAKEILAKNENLANVNYKLSWTEVKPFDYSLVYVSKSADLANAKTYVTYNHYINLNNLEMNNTYYYQIEGFEDDYSIKSDVYSFNTIDGARVMTLDGVENFRDIGSYKTKFENKRIRQNMIYRSGNADGITSMGKKKAKELYNIKTELDLREKGYWTNQSYFGEDVQYKHVSAEVGGVYYISRGVDGDTTGIATGGETLKEELLTFVNENNYPINFHCAIGRDRTGTLAMILLGLLGVSEEDICFDYLISGINGQAKAGSENHLEELYNNIYQTIQYIKNLTGLTDFSEAINAYLTTNFTGSNAKAKVGLTQAEVDAIKEIMLEDK